MPERPGGSGQAPGDRRAPVSLIDDQHRYAGGGGDPAVKRGRGSCERFGFPFYKEAAKLKRSWHGFGRGHIHFDYRLRPRLTGGQDPSESGNIGGPDRVSSGRAAKANGVVCRLGPMPVHTPGLARRGWSSVLASVGTSWSFTADGYDRLVSLKSSDVVETIKINEPLPHVGFPHLGLPRRDRWRGQLNLRSGWGWESGYVRVSLILIPGMK